MSVVTIQAETADLAKLLARVEAGEEIIIARGREFNRTAHAYPPSADGSAFRRLEGDRQRRSGVLRADDGSRAAGIGVA